MRIAPFPLIWYCMASRPETNTALLLAEMQVSCALDGLLESAMSPSRPPQPLVDPSLPSDCHTDCWSLCEKSLGGSGLATLLELLYCASVVGWINGPTLSWIASRPASNSDLSPLSCGANAYCSPSVSTAPSSGVSAVAARSARASAIPSSFSPAAPARIW